MEKLYRIGNGFVTTGLAVLTCKYIWHSKTPYILIIFCHFTAESPEDQVSKKKKLLVSLHFGDDLFIVRFASFLSFSNSRWCTMFLFFLIVIIYEVVKLRASGEPKVIKWDSIAKGRLEFGLHCF